MEVVVVVSYDRRTSANFRPLAIAGQATVLLLRTM